MTTLTRPGMTLAVATEDTTRAPYSVFREFRLGSANNPASPAVTYVRIEPHETAPRHAHPGWTINVVIEGSCRLADFPDIELKPGHVLTAEPNVQYGPVYPGPEGVSLFEIFDSLQARPPVWDDPNDPVALGYAKWLAKTFPEAFG